MSEVLDPPVTDPVTVALGELSSVLDRLADVDLWTLGDAQVLAATADLDRLRNRVEAAEHRLVREVDARGAAVQAGASSVAAWLRHRLRLHPGAAKRLVETAKSLHDGAEGALVPDGDTSPGGRALLREAFAAGEISAEPATAAAPSPAATGRRSGRRHITACTGKTAGRPRWPTAACSATSTTGSCTTTVGRWHCSTGSST